MLVLGTWNTPLLYGTLPSLSWSPGQPTPSPDALRSTHLPVRSLSARLPKGAHVLFKYMGAVTSLDLRREGEGGRGERVNETWVTQLLSEAGNSLWPKPWVSSRPHQLRDPWRTVSLAFCFNCQSPMAPRDQFVECAFLIKWWEQEQGQRKILHLKSFFWAPTPLTFLEVNARYLHMNHEPYLGALCNSETQVTVLVKKTQS